MRIGVLALQGAFAEHIAMLERCGAKAFEIRQKRDLAEPFDGLIIPGGESTVMGKLLRELGLSDTLKERINAGLPVFGTCAGLIVLAGSIGGEQPHLGTMHMTARRNAYGRQLGSFTTQADFAGIGEFPMVFIRAPYIEKADSDVQILARVDGKAVAARQGHQLVTAFHPELTEDTRVHEYFLRMAADRCL
jgi:5'-phosphate synthase pdxT subunit